MKSKSKPPRDGAVRLSINNFLVGLLSRVSSRRVSSQNRKRQQMYPAARVFVFLFFKLKSLPSLEASQTKDVAQARLKTATSKETAFLHKDLM